MTDPAPRRLFLALWPDPALQAELARLRAGLGGARGRAVHQADLHLTLVFLGEVDARRQVCVERVVDGIGCPPFDLLIDQVGHWHRSEVLWCGPSRVPEALARLVQDLGEGLAACGFTPERRPYAAHCTLLRHARPYPLQALERPLPWPVRDLALVASEPGGPPPHYRVLRRWPLTPPDRGPDR